MREEEMENPKSFGLIGIRERVFVWGGETQILSKEGDGTTIMVSIPWNKK
jgi:signal transduction histidine kinase